MTTEPNSTPAAPAPSPPRRGKLRTALWVAALLGVGGVIGAGVVNAQMGGGPWGGGWGGGHGWGGHGWRGDGPRWGGPDGRWGSRGPERFARFCGMNTARFQPVVRAYIKADLNLTDIQAKDFDTLADQVLPALEGVKQEACNNFAALSGKAPEKLAQFSAVLRKAADAADKAVDPARKFYAALDAEQQARVDELTERRAGRRWR